MKELEQEYKELIEKLKFEDEKLSHFIANKQMEDYKEKQKKAEQEHINKHKNMKINDISSQLERLVLNKRYLLQDRQHIDEQIHKIDIDIASAQIALFSEI